MKNMKDMRKLLIFLLAVSLQAGAQDMAHYKKIVKELASAKYQGRGYAKGGANKAGKFLEKEYRKAGADEVTLQPFKLDIQTFAGRMEMEAMTGIGQLDNSQLDNSSSNRQTVKSSNWKKLVPGVDFSMREYSPGVYGEFPVYHVDTLHFDADRMMADLAKPEYANCLVACDFWFTYKHRDVFSPADKGRLHQRRPYLPVGFPHQVLQSLRAPRCG